MKKIIKTLGIFEVMMITIMTIFTAVMAVDTFSSNSTLVECQEVATAITVAETLNNDPTKWVIENVTLDFTECEVTHADGWTYTHPIFKCWNEDNYLVLVLETTDGNLHEFVFVE